MEEALKLIVSKSPPAAGLALGVLAAIHAKSPMVQHRYNQAVQIALADPAAEWTANERALLADGLGIDDGGSRDKTIQIRLTAAEYADLLDRAAGGTVSEYVRSKLF